MADNTVTKQDFDELKSVFLDFTKTYNIDMRGDKNSDNGGRHGIVSNIRETRRLQREYPSLMWLLAHRPVKTWATIISVFVMLSSFVAVGLLNILGAMFGVEIPIP